MIVFVDVEEFTYWFVAGEVLRFRSFHAVDATLVDIERSKIGGEIETFALSHEQVGEVKVAKVVKLVDYTLEEKKQNPYADTTSLESEIDQLVYALYELTEEEIEIVENT